MSRPRLAIFDFVFDLFPVHYDRFSIYLYLCCTQQQFVCLKIVINLNQFNYWLHVYTSMELNNAPCVMIKPLLETLWSQTMNNFSKKFHQFD